jgi:hypothetical protein
VTRVRQHNSTLSVDTDKPLRRKTEMKRTAPKAGRYDKPSGPERDWADAIWKRDQQAVCRNCGGEWRLVFGRSLEAAHTVAREYDKPKPCPLCKGPGLIEAEIPMLGLRAGESCPVCEGHGSLTPDVLWVNPDDIVPLCGPSIDKSTCHGKDHDNTLDLLPLLTPTEQLRVVLHLGTIERARVRLLPSEYPSKIVPR